MYEKLKTHFKTIVPLTDEQLEPIDSYFELKELNKQEFLLRDGEVCSIICFVTKGTIRHFHIKDGIEKTCDISFENSWVTDFQSFTHEVPSIMNLQAMETTSILFIKKQNLIKLFKECDKYETFARITAEQVAQRSTEIAMSLSSEKPEERFQNLMRKQPDLFQRVPQKYIAAFLGINPESLSRIKKRILEK